MAGMTGFKNETHLQKYELNKLTEAVAEYLRMIELPKGSRHRKTLMVFRGDRFRPSEIKVGYVTPRK